MNEEEYFPETVTDEEDAYAEFDYDDGDYAYEHAIVGPAIYSA